MRTLRAVALACLVAGACGPRAAPPAPSGPSGMREKKMLNCPSAVALASTEARDVEGGIVLDITSDDTDATQQIWLRAQHQATLGEPRNTEPMHNGTHSGPGTLGHCPIIHTGTTVTVEQIFGGARVTVIANDPAAVVPLQRETRARLAWLDSSRR